MTTNFWIEVSDDSAQNLSGGFNNDFATVNFRENIDIDKRVDSRLNLDGNFATSESDADAVGRYTIAEVFNKTFTNSNTGRSFAQGTSISGSSNR